MLRGEAPFALREDVVNAKRATAETRAGRAGRCGRGAARGAESLARRDRGGAEAAGLCHFPRPDADRDGEGAPGELDDLAGIHGVGAVKLQKYGAAFLAVIRDHARMPELPEVETVRRGLEPAMLGARIEKVELRRADIRFPFPPHSRERLTGPADRRSRVAAPNTCCSGLDSGETLIAHLGMSGSFRIESREVRDAGVVPPRAFEGAQARPCRAGSR